MEMDSVSICVAAACVCGALVAAILAFFGWIGLAKKWDEVDPAVFVVGSLAAFLVGGAGIFCVGKAVQLSAIREGLHEVDKDSQVVPRKKVESPTGPERDVTFCPDYAHRFVAKVPLVYPTPAMLDWFSMRPNREDADFCAALSLADEENRVRKMGRDEASAYFAEMSAGIRAGRREVIPLGEQQRLRRIHPKLWDWRLP